MTSLATRLAAITARCAQATKGPWESPLRDLGRVESFKAVDFYFDESYEAYPPLGESGPVFVAPTREIADMLAHARTDLPLLVQALTRAVEALEQTARIVDRRYRHAATIAEQALAALDALGEDTGGA